MPVIERGGLVLNDGGLWTRATHWPPRTGEYRIFRGALWRWLGNQWVKQADAR